MPEPAPDVSAAQLIDAWLEAGEIEFNRHFAGDTDRVTYGLDTSTEVVSTTPGDAVAVLRIGVNWEHRDGGELPFHKLTVLVGGRFDWPHGDPGEDYVAGWLKFNGTYLLWPYARAFIATLTSLAGMPPLQLMTLNVPRPSLGQATSDFDAVDASDEQPT